jgi:hypothetical protein
MAAFGRFLPVVTGSYGSAADILGVFTKIEVISEAATPFSCL